MRQLWFNLHKPSISEQLQAHIRHPAVTDWCPNMGQVCFDMNKPSVSEQLQAHVKYPYVTELVFKHETIMT